MSSEGFYISLSSALTIRIQLGAYRNWFCTQLFASDGMSRCDCRCLTSILMQTVEMRRPHPLTVSRKNCFSQREAWFRFPDDSEEDHKFFEDLPGIFQIKKKFFKPLNCSRTVERNYSKKLDSILWGVKLTGCYLHVFGRVLSAATGDSFAARGDPCGLV